MSPIMTFFQRLLQLGYCFNYRNYSHQYLSKQVDEMKTWVLWNAAIIACLSKQKLVIKAKKVFQMQVRLILLDQSSA